MEFYSETRGERISNSARDVFVHMCVGFILLDAVQIFESDAIEPFTNLLWCAFARSTAGQTAPHPNCLANFHFELPFLIRYFMYRQNHIFVRFLHNLYFLLPSFTYSLASTTRISSNDLLTQSRSVRRHFGPADFVNSLTLRQFSSRSRRLLAEASLRNVGSRHLFTSLEDPVRESAGFA